MAGIIPKGATPPAWHEKPWFKETFATKKPRMELTELQQEFLDWLLDPNKEISQNQWARDHHVSSRTIANWKNSPLFRGEWDRQAYQLYGGPEKVNKIVDAVFEKAVSGDMKAAQLYLQYVDKFTPKREIITETKALAEMSDEELAELGENIVNLRQAK